MSREAINKMLKQLTENTQKAKEGFVTELVENIAVDYTGDFAELKQTVSEYKAELDKANESLSEIIEQLDDADSSVITKLDGISGPVMAQLNDIRSSIAAMSQQLDGVGVSVSSAPVQSSADGLSASLAKNIVDGSADRLSDEFADSLRNTAEKLYSDLKSAGSENRDAIELNLMELKEQMGDTSAIASLASDVKALRDEIASLSAKDDSASSQQLEGILAAGMSGITAELKSAGNDNRETLEMAIMELKEQIGELSNKESGLSDEQLKGILSSSADSVAADIKSAGSDNREALEMAIMELKEQIGELSNKESGLSEDKLQQIINSHNDAMSGGFEENQRLIGEVQNDLSSAAGMIISDVGSAVNDGIAGVNDSIINAKQEIIDEIRNASENAAPVSAGLSEDDIPLIADAVDSTVSSKNQELISLINAKMDALADVRSSDASEVTAKLNALSAELSKISETVEVSTQTSGEQIVSDLSAKVEEITENNKAMVDEFALGMSSLSDDVGSKLAEFSDANKSFLSELSSHSSTLEQEYEKTASAINAMKASESFIKQSSADLQAIRTSTDNLSKAIEAKVKAVETGFANINRVESQNHSNILSQMDSVTFGITKEIGLLSKDVQSVREYIDSNGDKVRELSDSIESSLASFTKVDGAIDRQQEVLGDVSEKCAKLSTNIVAIKKISDQIENNSNWQIESLDSNFRRLTTMLYFAIAMGIVDFIGLALVVVLFLFSGNIF